MTDHLASCASGRLRRVAHVDPIRVSMCQCLACQRGTGSTHDAQARLPTADVEIAGRSIGCVRIGDEGGAGRFHFFPACGATAYYGSGERRTIAGPAGVFADPGFPPPTFPVSEDRVHPGGRVPEGAEDMA